MKKFLVLLLNICFLFANGQNKPGTVLWEISKAGIPHKSYLYGTFHEVNPAFFDSSYNAVAYLKKSTIVFLEMDLGKTAIDTAALKEAYSWTPEKWNAVLNAKQKLIFQHFVERSHDSSYYLMTPAIEFFALWRIYGQYFCDTAGRSSYEIMDEHIYHTAVNNGIKVEGLDKNQLTDIHNSSKSDKVLAIASCAKSATDLMNKMDKNERSGPLFDFLFNYRDLTLDYHLSKKIKGVEILLNGRNDKWIPTLDRSFVAGPSFVAVGIGHLFYKDGLIQQLRRLGYTVKPVSLK
jgi:uncharacterized protein YbaP (TraB family)